MLPASQGINLRLKIKKKEAKVNDIKEKAPERSNSFKDFDCFVKRIKVVVERIDVK